MIKFLCHHRDVYLEALAFTAVCVSFLAVIVTNMDALDHDGHFWPRVAMVFFTGVLVFWFTGLFRRLMAIVGTRGDEK